MYTFKNKLFLWLIIIFSTLFANLLNESFTSPKFPPEGWKIYNMDNGIVCWRRSPAKNYSPPACARSRFEKRNIRNDDWLVTPQLYPTEGKDTLKFYYRAHNKNFQESLEVWVSISGNKPENFYTRVDAFGFRNREYAQRVIPLTQFREIPIFIAFRNVGLFGVNSCYIDDVSGVALTPCDVGVINIIRPRKIEELTSINPQITIKNFGTENAENFSLEISIYDENNNQVYYSIIDIPYLPANETLTITASNPWQATSGEYLAVAKTIYNLDKNPYNDEMNKNVRVPVGEYHDVGIKEIIYPIGYVPQGENIPVGLFENCGNYDEEFTAICLIYQNDNLVYGDTSLIFMEKFSEREISFKPFNVSEGEYQIVMKAILDNDMDLSNNEKLANFYSDNDFLLSFRDVGLVEILSPIGEYESDVLVSPEVKVKNYSYFTETFKITFNIKNSKDELIYSKEAFVYALMEGEERIVTFPMFRVEEGNFQVITYITNNCDQNPNNDTLIGNFLGKKPYTPPPGFSGWILRRDMPILEQNPKRIGSGAKLTYLDNYIYATKGNNSFEFYKYNPRFDRWTRETDIPKGEKEKGVKGGTLTSGNNKIYLIKGNGTKEFYAYNLETKTWERLKDLPFKVKDGACIAYLENANGKYLYLTKGGGSDIFLMYDINNDTFIFLKNIPKGSINKGAVKGSALCNFQNQFLYFLKGKSNEFYLYNIAADSWEIKAPMPLFTPGGMKKKSCGPGADLATDNERYIYALKGNNTDEFYLYDIQNNQWLYLDPLPLEPSNKKAKDGAALVYTNGFVYALKGNKTLELWLYVPPQDLHQVKNEEQKSITSLKTILLEEIKEKKINIYNSTGRKVEKSNRGIYFLIKQDKKIKKITIY